MMPTFLNITKAFDEVHNNVTHADKIKTYMKYFIRNKRNWLRYVELSCKNLKHAAIFFFFFFCRRWHHWERELGPYTWLYAHAHENIYNKGMQCASEYCTESKKTWLEGVSCDVLSDWKLSETDKLKHVRFMSYITINCSAFLPVIR